MAQTQADVAVHAVVDAVNTRHLANVVVDDLTMSTWLPRATLEAAGIRQERTQDFECPDGTIISRPIGFAILRVQGRETVEDVVFAEPGDRVRLGARTLSGLNLRIASDGTLVDGGPIIAASASTDVVRDIVARAHDQPLLGHYHSHALDGTRTAALPCAPRRQHGRVRHSDACPGSRQAAHSSPRTRPGVVRVAPHGADGELA